MFCVVKSSIIFHLWGLNVYKEVCTAFPNDRKAVVLTSQKDLGMKNNGYNLRIDLRVVSTKMRNVPNSEQFGIYFTVQFANCLQTDYSSF